MAELEARSALQKVRDLLQSYVMDAGGMQGVRAEFEHTAQATTRFLRQELDALESVLADELPPGTLLRLVEDDANWGLDDPSDAGAAAFLREVADILRSVIDSAR
ncbi:hypothetical protein C8E87_1680 [Paractinoplanes brasiliensis]|uniref:CdiI immunity protein domain-containing protein n=2 Tax=Paractinoplanes brasiliensis TaxID=52695 RepID=A0A4V3C7M2_9ACTN|nr:hypothetical protein C8E87_1680 [Actinoplanes brasiliensis]